MFKSGVTQHNNQIRVDRSVKVTVSVSEFFSPLSAPRSSHSSTYENGAPWLEDAQAAVLSEPRARSDCGEPRPAHRPTLRE